MTVEGNGTIAISTLSDWLKDLSPIFLLEQFSNDCRK